MVDFRSLISGALRSFETTVDAHNVSDVDVVLATTGKTIKTAKKQLGKLKYPKMVAMETSPLNLC